MAAVSLFREAVELYEVGDLSHAREAAERVLHAAEAHENELFAGALLLLSNTYCAAEEFAEAERLVATCCCFVEEHLGAAHLGAIATRINRAVILLEWYRLQGCNFSAVEKAYELLQEAEKRLKDVCGVKRLMLADVLHNSGVCCELIGRHIDALAAYMHSMQIRVRYKDAAGVSDLKLALTMEHVAMLYRLMERPKLLEASRLMDVVAGTRRRYLGPHHPLYAAAVLEQGVVAAELGQQRRATALLQKALEIRTELYGGDDPRARYVACLLMGLL